MSPQIPTEQWAQVVEKTGGRKLHLHARFLYLKDSNSV